MSGAPVVLKFGGTSLQTAARIRRAARRVAARLAERFGVPLRVYSFRAPLGGDAPGTVVRTERPAAGESAA